MTEALSLSDSEGHHDHDAAQAKSAQVREPADRTWRATGQRTRELEHENDSAPRLVVI